MPESQQPADLPQLVQQQLDMIQQQVREVEDGQSELQKALAPLQTGALANRTCQGVALLLRGCARDVHAPCTRDYHVDVDSNGTCLA